MKNKIEFFCNIEGLETIKECMPKPTKNYVPDWFKQIPSSMKNTVRSCPSFPDFFSQGYVIPMWQDAVIKYSKEKNQYAFQASPVDGKNPETIFSTHGNEQFIDYVTPYTQGVEGSFVFKFHSPWRIITPPGWSIMALPLFYHFNKDFTVLPGVIDTDMCHEINMQILYHGDEKDIFIPRGTPLAMYIPFKRKEKFELEVRFQNESDKRKMKIMETRATTKFPFSGFYRDWQRERDNG